MITVSKREYPYPVLAEGRDDFAQGYKYSFMVRADEAIVSEENIELPVSYELECPSLEKEITNGKFISIVKARSGAASFCRVFSFDTNSKEMIVKIPKYDVAEKIELTGLIVANEEVEHFSCEEMNDLYFAGMSFSLSKGDAIAMDSTKTIFIDDSELEKPLVSIFSINRNEEQQQCIDASFADNKININLNEELSKLYWNMKDFNNGALRRYITAIIVTPVLAEAIDLIKLHYLGGETEDFSKLRWFRAIELKAEKRGYILKDYEDSSSGLADILLGEISLDALKSFKDMLEQEMNNGETITTGGVD